MFIYKLSDNEVKEILNLHHTFNNNLNYHQLNKVLILSNLSMMTLANRALTEFLNCN